MDHRTLDNAALYRLCNGNPEAIHFVQLGSAYVHLSDDQVDEPLSSQAQSAKRACRLGAMALELYTHPFFIKHMPELKQVMLLNLQMYELSVAWENSEVPWQRNFSDWARHGWLNVCLVVGDICAGYDSTSAELPEMMAMAYVNHHDQSGKVY